MWIISATGCFLLLTILTTTNSASIKNQGSHLSGKENISQQIEKRDLENNGNGANAEIETLRNKRDDNGNFEEQHWDIRNNIPGEPDIDYPIYGKAPETNFICKDRHDGYYADIEARCQVFRVCANTDLTGKGFAFICPNGTLFNQEYFICDWYPNVECSQSESFYSRNEEIGKIIRSHSEMMTEVGKMISYTNTNQDSSQEGSTHNLYENHSNIESEDSFSQRIASPSSNTNQLATVPIPTIFNENESPKVFVSSLGELSTDIGTSFNSQTSVILKEDEINLPLAQESIESEASDKQENFYIPPPAEPFSVSTNQEVTNKYEHKTERNGYLPPVENNGYLPPTQRFIVRPTYAPAFIRKVSAPVPTPAVSYQNIQQTFSNETKNTLTQITNTQTVTTQTPTTTTIQQILTDVNTNDKPAFDTNSLHKIDVRFDDDITTPTISTTTSTTTTTTRKTTTTPRTTTSTPTTEIPTQPIIYKSTTARMEKSLGSLKKFQVASRIELDENVVETTTMSSFLDPVYRSTVALLNNAVSSIEEEEANKPTTESTTPFTPKSTTLKTDLFKDGNKQTVNVLINSDISPLSKDLSPPTFSTKLETQPPTVETIQQPMTTTTTTPPSPTIASRLNVEVQKPSNQLLTPFKPIVEVSSAEIKAEVKDEVKNEVISEASNNLVSESSVVVTPSLNFEFTTVSSVVVNEETDEANRVEYVKPNINLLPPIFKIEDLITEKIEEKTLAPPSFNTSPEQNDVTNSIISTTPTATVDFSPRFDNLVSTITPTPNKKLFIVTPSVVTFVEDNELSSPSPLPSPSPSPVSFNLDNNEGLTPFFQITTPIIETTTNPAPEPFVVTESETTEFSTFGTDDIKDSTVGFTTPYPYNLNILKDTSNIKYKKVTIRDNLVPPSIPTVEVLSTTTEENISENDIDVVSTGKDDNILRLLGKRFNNNKNLVPTPSKELQPPFLTVSKIKSDLLPILEKLGLGSTLIDEKLKEGDDLNILDSETSEDHITRVSYGRVAGFLNNILDNKKKIRTTKLTTIEPYIQSTYSDITESSYLEKDIIEPIVEKHVIESTNSVEDLSSDISAKNLLVMTQMIQDEETANKLKTKGMSKLNLIFNRNNITMQKTFVHSLNLVQDILKNHNGNSITVSENDILIKDGKRPNRNSLIGKMTGNYLTTNKTRTDDRKNTVDYNKIKNSYSQRSKSEDVKVTIQQSHDSTISHFSDINQPEKLISKPIEKPTFDVRFDSTNSLPLAPITVNENNIGKQPITSYEAPIYIQEDVNNNKPSISQISYTPQPNIQIQSIPSVSYTQTQHIQQSNQNYSQQTQKPIFKVQSVPSVSYASTSNNQQINHQIYQGSQSQAPKTNLRIQSVPSSQSHQNYQPQAQKTNFRTQSVPQIQQTHHQNSKVIVNVVPAYNYYLNDANDRRLYMNAVQRGIINNDGIYGINNNYQQRNQRYGPPSYQNRRSDNFFNGRSSYLAPQSSVGSLPCDSDSLTGRKLGRRIPPGCLTY